MFLNGEDRSFELTSRTAAMPHSVSELPRSEARPFIPPVQGIYGHEGKSGRTA